MITVEENATSIDVCRDGKVIATIVEGDDSIKIISKKLISTVSAPTDVQASQNELTITFYDQGEPE